VHIKKLEGEHRDMYRYRLGNLRILYEIHEDIKAIRIKAIEARGSVYK
jgi:mRNA interferase RelE/StbE